MTQLNTMGTVYDYQSKNVAQKKTLEFQENTQERFNITAAMFKLIKSYR